MAVIAIVGAGNMGSAIAWPLADNGHTVRLVGTHLDADVIASCQSRHFHPRLKRELPPRVQAFPVQEIATALEGVEVIVSGVNSLGVEWIGRTLAPHLRSGQTILSVTKGLAVDTEGNPAILPDTLAAQLPSTLRDQVKHAAIVGPCLAGELAARRHSAVVFGSRDPETVTWLAQAFRTPYYHIWTTTDLVGIEYSAALKNAYSLGVGLAFGLLDAAGGPDAAGAYMHNTAAALFAQGCIETDRILRAVGSSTAWTAGLPVAGDMYVTSAGGLSMQLGRLLGAGHTLAQARQIMAGFTLEAAEILDALSRALPQWIARGALQPHALPLLEALIDQVVYGKRSGIQFDQFFQV